MMATTFSQLVESGVLSGVAAINYWWRCSTIITDRPIEQFRKILNTAYAISLSSGMESLTGNGCTPTGIGCTGGGT